MLDVAMDALFELSGPLAMLVREVLVGPSAPIGWTLEEERAAHVDEGSASKGSPLQECGRCAPAELAS